MTAEFDARDPEFPRELMCVPGPAPWESRTGWLTMSDGAVIWFADTGGDKQPLVLVHGWAGSSLSWRKNVPDLARDFRVVTVDLRGHGSSSKILHGQTLMRYARDLREVVVQLGLLRPAFAGSSMGGSVLMEYWRRFGHAAEVLALALVDSSIAPFADGDWNAFRLKDSKMEGLAAAQLAQRTDYEGFAKAFVPTMFVTKPPQAEMDALCAEMSKTPPWIAAAIYSDFVMHNYEPLLPGVTVPAAVFSGFFPNGKSLAMGRHFASRLPGGRYFPHPDAGHLLFYEKPEAFNSELADFLKEAME